MTWLGVWSRPPAQADALASGKPGIDVAFPLLPILTVNTTMHLLLPLCVLHRLISVNVHDARYRDMVAARRSHVHHVSGGTVGYLQVLPLPFALPSACGLSFSERCTALALNPEV